MPNKSNLENVNKLNLSTIIGQGAGGTVLKGFDQASGTELAVKVINFEDDKLKG